MDPLKRYVIDLGTSVNEHMKKWLSREINVASFLKFVSNIWDFGNKPLYTGRTDGTIYVKQIWCPEKINIQTSLYSIYWKLTEVVYYSEEATLISGEEIDIPFVPEENVLQIQTSLREILKERIRRYRLRAAFYQEKVNMLSARYYERYGITELSDNASVLSVESEDESWIREFSILDFHQKYWLSLLLEEHMTGSKDGMQSLFLLAGLAVVVVALSYLQPNLFVGGREGFQSTMSAASNTAVPAGATSAPGPGRERAVKNAPEVAPMQQNGPADFGSAESPAGCYPRDQLTPSELLPKDSNSVWAEQNPMGTGSLKGKNFLSAGALIGVNTVGQTLRNANYQLRSEPPNPQVPVSVFNVPTIEPDMNRRALEIA